MLVNELLNARCNAGLREPLHYWRDNIGPKVDAVPQRGNDNAAIEIKSGPTVASDAVAASDGWHERATRHGHFCAAHPALVYGGDIRFTPDGGDVMPWPAL
jgi:hypothetical protein